LYKLFLTFLLLIAACSGPAAATEGSAPEVSAQSYILFDDTGNTVCSRNADKRLPVASTTKIMTAVVAIELDELEKTIDVKKEHTLAEGSRMYLREGEEISLIDLLYGLLLTSGNDAALAISELVCGNAESFVAEMNIKAEALGMANTRFVNPSGLPQDGQYSTARDMAILMEYAMKNEVFAEISGTRRVVRAGRTLVNHNKLIGACPGVDGGKTGYTKQAGRCLVSTACRNGRRLYAVTLNAPDDWDDHAKLYDYGFSRYICVNVFEAGDFDVPLAIVGGHCGSVKLYIKDDIAYYLTSEELEKSEIIIFIPKFEYAPVYKDQKIGCAVFVCGDVEFARAGLFCKSDVLYKSRNTS
jgi:D-alanyl-D-alanine carboxypeptidase (penicillin-binding protein 5/6)